MAFRSSEYLQRNELVRYQLDDVIRSARKQSTSSQKWL